MGCGSVGGCCQLRWMGPGGETEWLLSVTGSLGDPRVGQGCRGPQGASPPHHPQGVSPCLPQLGRRLQGTHYSVQSDIWSMGLSWWNCPRKVPHPRRALRSWRPYSVGPWLMGAEGETSQRISPTAEAPGRPISGRAPGWGFRLGWAPEPRDGSCLPTGPSQCLSPWAVLPAVSSPPDGPVASGDSTTASAQTLHVWGRCLLLPAGCIERLSPQPRRGVG